MPEEGARPPSHEAHHGRFTLPPRKPPSTLLALLAWISGITALYLVGALAADVIGGWILGILLAAILIAAGFGLVVFCVTRKLVPLEPSGKPRDGVCISLLVLAAMFGPLACPLGDEGLAVLTRGVAKGVLAKDLAAHTGRALIEVDGTLRSDLAGVKKEIESTGSTLDEPSTYSEYVVDFHAAPLVSPGWKPTEPVPAWLVSCETPLVWPKTGKGVVEPLRAGNYQANGWRSHARFENAVANAIEKHHLHADDGAPLFLAGDSLESEVHWRIGWLASSLGLLDLLVATLLVVGYRQARSP